MSTTTTTPATPAELTAGHVAAALTAAGHPVQITYLGHGNVEVSVPVPGDRRILVHGYFETADWTNPAGATLETYDNSPGVILADNATDEVSTRDEDVIWLDADADAETIYARTSVSDLLAFTVRAVSDLAARVWN